jgi:hypothetical protein
MTKKSGKAKEHKKPEDAERKKRPLALPIIQVPNDKEELESEMQDLFNEDKVEHIQGNIEPEAD